MRTGIRFVALSVIGLAGLLPAQRTWIVDCLNRPGSDFTDVPPAVMAAAAGDTVAVRMAGSCYNAPSIDRPLRLIGIRDLGTGEFVPLRKRMRITNIGAGSEVVVSGFSLWGPWTVGDPHGLEATNCAGRIHLENVWIDGGSLPNGLISFTDCADVSVHWSTLAAEGQPVNFVRSPGRIANSVVFGRDRGPLGPPECEAMRVENCEVRVVSSLVKGANNYNAPSGDGMPGIILANGTVYAGPGATIIPGTQAACSCTSGLGAIGTGTIWKDPDAIVWTLPPTVQLRPLEQPSTSAELVTRGQPFRAFAYGPRGGFALLALGFPTHAPTPIIPLGNLWLDPNSMLVVAAGPIDNRGVLERTFACWSGAPMDMLFAFQGGVLWPNGNAALTQPVLFSVQWPVGQSWP